MIWPLKTDTLNICLGHQAFPEQCSNFVDLNLAPKPFESAIRTICIGDEYFGEHGNSLSEYVQLMWLHDNFDRIVGWHKFVHIFQYRRFISLAPIGAESNSPYMRWIPPSDLPRHETYFSRARKTELFNQIHYFPHGVAWQYGEAHVLFDFINFCNFMLEEGILNVDLVGRFMGEQRIIPASNMGVFRAETLREILSVLRRAAEFVNSSYFVPRTGYQRRLVGFLLERLNSFLILQRIAAGSSPANHGWHVVISDGPEIATTRTTIG